MHLHMQNDMGEHLKLVEETLHMDRSVLSSVSPSTTSRLFLTTTATGGIEKVHCNTEATADAFASSGEARLITDPTRI